MGRTIENNGNLRCQAAGPKSIDIPIHSPFNAWLKLVYCCEASAVAILTNAAGDGIERLGSSSGPSSPDPGDAVDERNGSDKHLQLGMPGPFNGIEHRLEVEPPTARRDESCRLSTPVGREHCMKLVELNAM